MAFLRFSRDKRGYEHFYLVEPGRGKARPRMLFWFRTPPNVKVGRAPFDPEIRRMLEKRYPDVTFDWATIVDTPIPPPVEPERWRERRRLERAMRAAQSEEPDIAAAPEPPEARPMQSAEAVVAAAPGESSPANGPDATSNLTAAANLEGRTRRRRRRRRGRKGAAVAPTPVPGSEVPGSLGQPAEAQAAQETGIQNFEEPGDEEDDAT